MAWPCISRVCCLARFWSQLDRSDLSVPLTIQNYSAIGEPEGRHEPADRTPRSAARQKEAGFEALEECRPAGDTFHSVTRYKEDFQPWPVPRKETFPWIGEGSRQERLPDGPRCPRDATQEPGGAGARRQKYRPWMGTRPPKLTQKRPVHTNPSVTELPRETSYQAAFSGDTFKHMEMLQVDPMGGEQHYLPERQQLKIATRGEKQLIKTKLSPNPSAIFQSGSRTNT